MNETTDLKRKQRIGLLEIIIPLFYLLDQYVIAGLHLGILLVILVLGYDIVKYKSIYFYKPLLVLFLFMLIHDLLRMVIAGFNAGLWIERVAYLLLLACIPQRVNKENLYKVWKIVGLVVMAGIFYQSIQVYILGQPVATLHLLPFLQSNSENFLLKYDRPHSFFLEPAAFCTWVLPFLYMCMERKKHVWMVTISISVLLSTSSTGILLTGVVWMYYAYVSVFKEKKSINALIIAGVLVIGIAAFSSMGIFSIALNKLTSISLSNTSNAVRLILGFQLYAAAPISYKIFGIPYLNVESYMRSGEVPLSQYGLRPDIPYLGYVNSISNCMLVYGIVGLVLYLILFRRIWKETEGCSKCYVLLCMISIFGQSVFWNSLFVTQMAVMLCTVNSKSILKLRLDTKRNEKFV